MVSFKYVKSIWGAESRLINTALVALTSFSSGLSVGVGSPNRRTYSFSVAPSNTIGGVTSLEIAVQTGGGGEGGRGGKGRRGEGR